MDAAGALQPNPPLKLQPDRGAGSVLVPEQGGYKEKFVKTVEDKYKCEKCRLVLCNPKQTECGHRFCESCMAALLRWVLHMSADCLGGQPSDPSKTLNLNDFQSTREAFRVTQAPLTPCLPHTARAQASPLVSSVALALRPWSSCVPTCAAVLRTGSLCFTVVMPNGRKSSILKGAPGPGEGKVGVSCRTEQVLILHACLGGAQRSGCRDPRSS